MEEYYVHADWKDRTKLDWYLAALRADIVNAPHLPHPKTQQDWTQPVDKLIPPNKDKKLKVQDHSRPRIPTREEALDIQIQMKKSHLRAMRKAQGLE